MKEEKVDQISDLSSALFWDIDRSKLTWEDSSDYIIERVAYLGNLQDWLIVRRIYGDDRLKKVILNMRYLDEKSTHYFAELFGLPLKSFRCYKLRQSGQIPYPF